MGNVICSVLKIQNTHVDLLGQIVFILLPTMLMKDVQNNQRIVVSKEDTIYLTNANKLVIILQREQLVKINALKRKVVRMIFQIV